MTKLEYIENKQKIEDTIRDLRQQLKSLESQYIESNRIFKDGEKVKITTKEHPFWTISKGKSVSGISPKRERFAFVYEYELFCDEPKPVLKKCKKDGTMSKVNDYIGHFSTLSSIK